jgi:hypothetical protein
MRGAELEKRNGVKLGALLFFRPVLLTPTGQAYRRRFLRAVTVFIVGLVVWMAFDLAARGVPIV